MEKKKIRHQYVASQCSYSVCTIHLPIHYDGSARIHHGGATNAQHASTILYGASTIQAGSATVASPPPMNVHNLVVVMPQS